MLVGVLVVLAAGTGITGSLGAPLVPEVAAQEGIRLPTAQWILTAPFLVGAVAAPVVGRVGAGRRRRPVLLIMLALAALGAAIAALPLGIGTMIVGRCLQGLAFSITPLLFAVAGESLDASRRRSAIGALSVANVASAGLGYPITASIVEFANIPTAFWAGAAFMGIALVLALLTIPGSTEDAPARVDVLGALLMMGGILALLMMISQSGVWPWELCAAMLALSVILLGGAVLWFRRISFPLVDLALAARPGVLGLHIAGLMLGIGCYVLLGVVTVVVQADPRVTGYGQDGSVLASGLLLVPYAAFSVVGNRLAAPFEARWGARWLLPFGCLVFALACASFALWHAEPWQAVMAMALGGTAGGLSFNAIPALMIGSVPGSEISSALGLNVVVRFAGFAMGSALSTALLEHAASGRGDLAVAFAMLSGVVFCLAAGFAAIWLLRPTAGALPLDENAPGRVATGH